jgi:hypothetical protein
MDGKTDMADTSMLLQLRVVKHEKISFCDLLYDTCIAFKGRMVVNTKVERILKWLWPELIFWLILKDTGNN